MKFEKRIPNLRIGVRIKDTNAVEREECRLFSYERSLKKVAVTGNQRQAVIAEPPFFGSAFVPSFALLLFFFVSS